ncbi:hypothetical protein ACFQ49_10330 [Kroppenstedtia eburnea]|uniref:hypothetical protein n=2 Tax=Kroppenstedtia eburnea TaxID=714067 RepID=UPI003629B166
MIHIKYALSFYRQQILKILLLILVFFIPLQLTSLLISNLLVLYYEPLGIPSFGLFLGTCVNLLMICLVQMPFIHMVIQDQIGDGVKVKNALGATLEKGFRVYLWSLVYILMVALGTLLLVVPGVILAILFFILPYVVMIEKEKGWANLKTAFQIGKENFLRIAGVLFLFGVIQWLLESGVLVGSIMLVDSFLVVAIIQTGVSSLVYPLFIFLLTHMYLDWTGANYDLV